MHLLHPHLHGHIGRDIQHLQQCRVHISDLTAKIGNEHALGCSAQYGIQKRLALLQMADQLLALMLYAVESHRDLLQLLHAGGEIETRALALTHFTNLRFKIVQWLENASQQPP